MVWMKETILHGCIIDINLYVSVINSVMNLVTAVLISMHCKFMFECIAYNIIICSRT